MYCIVSWSCRGEGGKKSISFRPKTTKQNRKQNFTVLEFIEKINEYIYANKKRSIENSFICVFYLAFAFKKNIIIIIQKKLMHFSLCRFVPT